ncbi:MULTISPECIES: efflux RND transporter periplasmic adaptor subunit [Shewanella]|jgi:HlyD family secretion protein|uniref:efflux RND transporter periplasmic adaptor subunit n=1 Tax=Shewanella TaxID=22 RepID=UPI001671AF63|nr:HlyD family efflux transporter periplasmic adaptor subunit [Shewanella fodinae]MCL2906982.1 HlyD family efflux transporter periplasmic adaptor subunit [Shewanella fodinae]GGZ05949.1 RND transporter MFP subunit [Shewanella fodinae]
MIRDTAGQDVILQPKSKSRYGMYAAVALLVVVLIVMLVQRWQRAAATDMTVPRASVQIATVSTGDVLRDLSVQGKVVAANSPTLYSTAQGIVTYEVKAGDRVKSGQLLAQLDSPQTTSQLKQQQATLAQLQGELEQHRIKAQRDLLEKQQAQDLAQVDLNAAKRELQRNADARQDKVISDRDYQRSKDELARAEVVFKQSEASLQLVRQSIRYEEETLAQQIKAQQLLVAEWQRQADNLQVLSPVDGMVGSLAEAQKAAVPAYQPLLTVVDLSGYEVEVMVPESYANELALSMPVEIASDGRQYPGQIAAISPEITNGQVVARLRFSAETPAQIRQNQRLSGRILLENRLQVVRVERGSFVDSDNGRSVFVVEGNQARRVPLTLGASGFKYVEITSGVKPGQQVIVSDTSRFKTADSLLLTD